MKRSHESYQIMQLSWQGAMISKTFKWGIWYLLRPPQVNTTVTLFDMLPQCKRTIMTTAVFLRFYLQWYIKWTNIEILVIHYTAEVPMERGVPLCRYMIQHLIHLQAISMMIISINYYSIWIIHAILEWIPHWKRLNNWHIW